MIRRTLAAFLAVSCLLAATACSEAKASQDVVEFETEISDSQISDSQLQGEQRSIDEILAHFRELAANMRENQRDATSDTETGSEYVLPSDVYAEPYDASGGFDPELNNNPAYIGSYGGNPNGLNSFDGVYDYNGHHETFYASYAAYDDQLWVDDDGFFRDDQGRYVVASEDYAQGTEIEISQGKAVVMDGGCEPGTVDVHTTWGR